MHPKQLARAVKIAAGSRQCFKYFSIFTHSSSLYLKKSIRNLSVMFLRKKSKSKISKDTEPFRHTRFGRFSEPWKSGVPAKNSDLQKLNFQLSIQFD